MSGIRFASVGSARVGFDVRGSGDLDIVYSPGLASHLDLTIEQPRYRRYIEMLERLGRVIRFDRRGTGVSDPIPAGAGESWETWADDLAAVLDAAGSEEAAIVATNDAGSAAILFAATRPERVRALILFNTSARFASAPDYPDGHPPEVAEAVVNLLREKWGTEEGASLLAGSLAGDQPFLQWYSRFQRAACSPGAMAETTERLFAMDARAVLSEVRCPTLVIHREDYGILGPGHARYLADHIPGAELDLVPGSDAPIYTENTEPILDRIGSFLGREPAPEADQRAFRTVLFTDIVASTERAVKLGDRGWRQVIEEHDAITRALVDASGGRTIKSTGDGTLATFEAPTRALRCAGELRDRIAGLDLEIRAGLHAGRLSVHSDGDVSGIAVNVAARALAKADAGEIVATRSVTDLVTGAEFEFEHRGEHELKGLPGSWELFSRE